MKHFLIVAPFIFLTCACESKLSDADFLNSITKDESFVKSVQLENYRIKCAFLPCTYMAIKEAMKQSVGSKINEADLSGIRAKYNNAFYFSYVIASADGKSIITNLAHSQQEYAYLLSELTYNMHTMLYMVRDNKDTLRPLTYNYDNLYSSGNTLNFLFAFPKSEAGEKIDVVFDDKLLGTGSSAVITYRLKDLIKKLPEIKI